MKDGYIIVAMVFATLSALGAGWHCVEMFNYKLREATRRKSARLFLMCLFGFVTSPLWPLLTLGIIGYSIYLAIKLVRTK